MSHRTPRTTKRRRAQRWSGHPSKLPLATREQLISDIRAGLYYETAAARAGIHISTFYRWLAAGREDDAAPELRELCEGVTRARADAEARMVATVQRAAMGGAVTKRITRTLRDGTTETDEAYAPPDGRTALEWLARAFPGRWAPRRAIEVTGADGGPIEIEQQATPLPELAQRLRETIAIAAHEDGDAGDVVDGEVIDGDGGRGAAGAGM